MIQSDFERYDWKPNDKKNLDKNTAISKDDVSFEARKFLDKKKRLKLQYNSDPEFLRNRRKKL
jgi:hypothetical protein